jgi:ABC-type multidrug transport system ATPase subunit
MNLMIGQVRPTRGTVLVHGQDVRGAYDDIKPAIGLCPQHNVLWEDISVEEHLRFFRRLKGLAPDEAENVAVEAMLEDLGMLDIRRTLAGVLSGGQKRRLCCGIALVRVVNRLQCHS